MCTFTRPRAQPKSKRLFYCVQREERKKSAMRTAMPFPFPTPRTAVRYDPAAVMAWTAHIQQALPLFQRHEADVLAAMPTASESAIGCIVLIEPRDSLLIEFAIKAASFSLRGWGVCIVHGTDNEAFVRTLFGGWPNVLLLNARVRNLPQNAYNSLLTTPAFWDAMPHENLLFIQTDVVILQGFDASHAAWNYEYVGAPWSYTCIACGALTTPAKSVCGHMIDHKALQNVAPNLVGNGGFSFRKKSAMRQACSNFRLACERAAEIDELWGKPPPEAIPIPHTTQEDVFFSSAVPRVGGRVAPRDIALTFGVEQVQPIALEWGKPCAIGLHKPWGYMSQHCVEAMLSGAAYLHLPMGQKHE